MRVPLRFRTGVFLVVVLRIDVARLDAVFLERFDAVVPLFALLARVERLGVAAERERPPADDERRPPADEVVPPRELRFGCGTFAPARRASERPIAIACFRLVTFLPERPLFSVPRFRSRIALRTFVCACFP